MQSLIQKQLTEAENVNGKRQKNEWSILSTIVLPCPWKHNQGMSFLLMKK